MQFLADVNFPYFEIGNNLMILLIVIFALIFRVVIGFLHHKQIMAAIEKGTLLNELQPVRKGSRWILSTAIGTGLLILACLLFCILLSGLSGKGGFHFGQTLVFLILCAAVGTTFLVYGLLSRKQVKKTPPEEDNAP